MTKITSFLAIVGLSYLSLIAQADHTPPTSVGNHVYPNGLVIPDAIAVNLQHNKFAFSLCALATVDFQCNASSHSWGFVGPVGVLANECKDLEYAVDNPKFITAVSLDDIQTSNDLVIHSAGFRSALLPGDTSTSLFTVEAAAPAPNPSVDSDWVRSKAFNQTGVGAFSDVTYLQLVYTKGGLTPPASQCGTTFPDKYVYPSRFSGTLLFYKAK
ncbi:hypothetical protein Glove_114g29 [Diversispora epigaea]|uniref:DOMON domain-containing protein n=1 Tax=Diversispora epigaea TaxID=1348612 RepID=A0A397JA05_9GLOM|nr:hypothetical protein Glove_114g29 [Diversispora epigaea]